MEKRRYERVDFFCRVLLAIQPDGPTVEANTLDVSLGGVGVMTGSVFEKGQLVTISFFLKDRSQKDITDNVMGRVANVRADYDITRVGVEFLEPLRESEHPVLVKKVVAL